MILRPEQIRLLRAGCPVVPANRGGSGGSTSSSSTQSTTTKNTDRRIANDNGVVATDGATINYNSTDAGIVKNALDFAAVADATNGDGFAKLLDTVDKLTTKTQDTSTTLASRFQDNVMQAYTQAKADASGGIDQRTMIVLGVSAMAALAFMKGKH